MKKDKLYSYYNRLPSSKGKYNGTDQDGFDDNIVITILDVAMEDIAESLDDPVEEIVKSPADLRQIHLDSIITDIIRKAGNLQSFSHWDKAVQAYKAGDKNTFQHRCEMCVRSSIWNAIVLGTLQDLKTYWNLSPDPVKFKEALRSCPDTSFLNDYLDKYREPSAEDAEREAQTVSSDGEMGNGIANGMITALRDVKDMPSGLATSLNEKQLVKLLDLLKTTEPEKGMLADKFRPRVFVSKETKNDDWLNLFRAHSKRALKVKWTMITKQGNVGKRPLRDLLSLLCSDKKQITISMLNRFQLIDKNGNPGKAFTAQDMTKDSESTYHDMFVKMIDEAMKV